MSAPASIPVFGDAYLADTQHLTLEEHGAYFKLMIVAWRSPNCALPDDDRRIATMLGVGAKKWAALRPAVMAFWTLGTDGWQQKRLLKEYIWATDKAKRNSEAANARWSDKSRKTHNTLDANAYAADDANGDAPPPPPPKAQKAAPSSPRAKTPAATGTRIDSCWEPSRLLPADLSVAVEAWPPGKLERELSKFRDYWAARPGAGGRKADWEATWRNWLWKADEDLNRDRSTHRSIDRSGQGRPRLLADDFAERFAGVG